MLGRKCENQLTKIPLRPQVERANVLTEVRNQILNDGFKGLTLINGGGAGALGVFLQAIWDKQSAATMRAWLLCGMGWLLFGTAISAVIFVARYLASFNPNSAKPTQNPWWWATLVAIGLSLACFLVGMGIAIYGAFVALRST